MPLPEADGGFGGGAVDLMARWSLIGEALVVEPLLDHVGSGRPAAGARGSAAQRGERCCPGGRRRAEAGLRATGAGPRYDLAPHVHHRRSAGDGWVLNGEKRVVLGAPLGRRGWWSRPPTGDGWRRLFLSTRQGRACR
jgi:alkylation response protein AidB-like acyl-CoA dehydrogenase